MIMRGWMRAYDSSFGTDPRKSRITANSELWNCNRRSLTAFGMTLCFCL